MLIDFWNYHFGDWLHDLQEDRALEPQAALVVIPGEKRLEEASRRVLGHPHSLRLIQGGKITSPMRAGRRRSSGF